MASPNLRQSSPAGVLGEVDYPPRTKFKTLSSRGSFPNTSGCKRRPFQGPKIEAASAAAPVSSLYCGFLAPHFLVSSIQTPPAFSHSALVFASVIAAKAGAAKAVATAKVTHAKRSLFMVISPFVMLPIKGNEPERHGPERLIQNERRSFRFGGSVSFWPAFGLKPTLLN